MNNEEGKIYITISDDRGKGGSSGKGGNRTGGFDDVNPLNKENDKLGKILGHETLHFLKSETMQMINHYIGTIGVRTGDYVLQQNAQSAFGVAQKGIGIGALVVTGWKVSGGNPLGAALGLVAGLTLSGTNAFLGQENQMRQIRMNNRDVALIRERAGLDINNGSR